MSEIAFKGEMHVIPPDAALVLQVDRRITPDQAARIQDHCREVLGGQRRVLVLGPELTPVVGVTAAGDHQP